MHTFTFTYLWLMISDVWNWWSHILSEEHIILFCLTKLLSWTYYTQVILFLSVTGKPWVCKHQQNSWLLWWMWVHVFNLWSEWITNRPLYSCLLSDLAFEPYCFCCVNQVVLMLTRCIYMRKPERSLSKQGHLQPRCHSKDRSPSRQL